MRIRPDRAHRWDISPAEAVEVQRRLRSLVSLEPPAQRPLTVAGCDVSYDGATGRFFGAVLVFRLPGLELLEQVEHAGTIAYPYIPGLFSFREAPVLLATLARLSASPDALLIDGHGIAHPRRFGVACHVGVLLDVPAVGCAKSLLVGSHRPPGAQRGEWSPLMHKDETVGAVLRTRTGVRPVFVSPGHKMDLASSIDLVLAAGSGTRLPEPTHRADKVAGEARRRAST